MRTLNAMNDNDELVTINVDDAEQFYIDEHGMYYCKIKGQNYWLFQLKDHQKRALFSVY